MTAVSSCLCEKFTTTLLVASTLQDRNSGWVPPIQLLWICHGWNDDPRWALFLWYWNEFGCYPNMGHSIISRCYVSVFSDWFFALYAGSTTSYSVKLVLPRPEKKSGGEEMWRKAGCGICSNDYRTNANLSGTRFIGQIFSREFSSHEQRSIGPWSLCC